MLYMSMVFDGFLIFGIRLYLVCFVLFWWYLVRFRFVWIFSIRLGHHVETNHDIREVML
jgi:hypothetical protein